MKKPVRLNPSTFKVTDVKHSRKSEKRSFVSLIDFFHCSARFRKIWSTRWLFHGGVGRQFRPICKWLGIMSISEAINCDSMDIISLVWSNFWHFWRRLYKCHSSYIIVKIRGAFQLYPAPKPAPLWNKQELTGLTRMTNMISSYQSICIFYVLWVFSIPT